MSAWLPLASHYIGLAAVIKVSEWKRLFKHRIEYGGNIDKASHLVREIKNKERKDELWVKGTFYTFMGSSLYIFLKRFYLKELLGYLIWALFSLIAFIYS